ncbi:Mov34/MPN/PAD-1 family protein [Acuticoccus sediminis]|uniref:Mov34/MPN/PAD-1 family protein n=1 Tax=Acuticoccus sediminis TaxID=2184697 RepID=UPI001FD44EE7|nr:Mov34/MPN/PAD-1 family protein [Acuticoccus sediminis]
MDVELTLQEAHQAELKRLLHREDGTEAAAYVLYGVNQIGVDPWSRQARLRLTSFEIISIPYHDAVSASERHITWRTDSYVSLCRRAAKEGLLPGIVHSHPGGFSDFSTQDDRNERELFRLARNRNGDEARLLSLLLIGKDRFRARLWVVRRSLLRSARSALWAPGSSIRRSVRRPRRQLLTGRPARSAPG